MYRSSNPSEGGRGSLETVPPQFLKWINSTCAVLCLIESAGGLRANRFDPFQRWVEGGCALRAAICSALATFIFNGSRSTPFLGVTVTHFTNSAITTGGYVHIIKGPLQTYPTFHTYHMAYMCVFRYLFTELHIHQQLRGFSFNFYIECNTPKNHWIPKLLVTGDAKTRVTPIFFGGS